MDKLNFMREELQQIKSLLRRPDSRQHPESECEGRRADNTIMLILAQKIKNTEKFFERK